MLKRLATVCVLAILAGGAAWAGNGHMLHGIGPVNSAMGGAGAGLYTEPAGALLFNPALMTRADGNDLMFSTEFFEDGIRIVTTVGGQTGVTNPTNQLGVLPAFGWIGKRPGSKWAFGFGLLAVAGFRTDYPEDPSSIVFDTPPNGFGRIYTDYRVTKVPFALAYQATPNLSLGFALNAYIGELAINPLPHVTRDVQGDLDIFYPPGGNLVNEFTFSPQIGFLYDINDRYSLGGSLTLKQQYDNFQWNSTIADPESAAFGQHRDLDFDLDGPLLATVGLGVSATDNLRIAFDVMYLKYEGVAGFGSPGGVQLDGLAPDGVDGVVFPFGWRDVYVGKLGVEWAVNDMWTIRGGYNHGNTPLKDRVVLTATGAPSTFQKHFCAGVSLSLTDKMSADLGAYIVPREEIRGPFPDITNTPQGTMETSNKLTSVLVGLNWKL